MDTSYYDPEISSSFLDMLSHYRDWDNDQAFQKFLMDEIHDYWETEDLKAWIEGRAQGQRELARREHLTNEKSEKLGKTAKIYWITVNPKHDITTEEMTKSIHKMYSKKWVKNSYYIFEVSEKKHQHSHGIIVSDYEYKRAIKELASSVKGICDTDNGRCFQVRVIDSSNAQQKMDYMVGKKATNKLEGVRLSKLWREENLIADYYGNPHILLDSLEFPIKKNDLT